MRYYAGRISTEQGIGAVDLIFFVYFKSTPTFSVGVDFLYK